MTPRQDHLALAGRRIALLALLAIFLGLGCAGRVYRASNLPAEFVAPASMNLDTIDLSSLADNTVSQDVIQPRDVLDVAMVTDYTKLTSTTTPVRVADDGTVTVPLIGKVGVAGLTAEQAEQIIGAESVTRGVFRNPCITVTMKQRRMNKVTVVGAVNKPGTHELTRGASSLMDALVAADGLCKDAGGEVEIRRNGAGSFAVGPPTERPPYAAGNPGAEGTLAAYQAAPASPAIVKVNLTAATAGMEKAPDLRDGDVVNVIKRQLRPVYVLGLVGKPGEIPYPHNQELRVLDALALAGGCSSSVADKMLVIRRPPGSTAPIQIILSIQDAKSGQDNLALAPGDTLTVEQTPATVAVDVLKSFIHFGFGATLPMF